MNPFQSIFDKQQQFFNKELKLASVQSRIRKLRKIKKWIKSNENLICEEIKKDFNKGTEEVLLTEIKPIWDELNQAISNLEDWSAPTKVKSPLTFIGTKSKVIYEPKGVSLIIAPWNYPFNLCIGPLVSAISAGCTAIIKPSENTPNTSKLIKQMIFELFNKNEVAVELGDQTASQELLKLPFNHIFFTGSPKVGKIVMKAAAENLTSVTLELGGRNPLVVDKTANIKDAARKIVWGKFLNSGQTCIAPNFIYVHASKHEVLTKELINEIERQQFTDKKSNSRIVNSTHFNRIKALLTDTISAGGKVVFGNKLEEEINFISPTILTGINEQSPVFQEEIFGPILPILTYNNLEEVISKLNQMEEPLAFYVFSKSRKNINYLIENTRAGTTCINETTIQFGQPHLPFGGLGTSGLGKAHGKYGFLEFTNQRAVLKQRIGLTNLRLIFPPYSKFKKKLIRFITFKL